jgi:sirohydrochlorin ferrochelatase
MKSIFRHFVLLWLFAAAAFANAAPQPAPIGFLVAAPDRGFMGNEEIRELFEQFAAKHNAALLHVTDERTRSTAQDALAALAKRGARKVVVLPLFYTSEEARFGVLRSALDGKQAMPVEWAMPFGASYFAVEALADRLRALPASESRRLVVAGSGAADAASADRMAAQLRRIANQAAEGLKFSSIDAAVWPESRSPAEEPLRKQAQDRLASGAGAIVVPLHLGRKLDSMMAFSNTLQRAMPKEGRLLAEESLTPLALTWMQREANRRLPLAADQVGVVIAAHGSDWHWNETMRGALRALERRHKVEYAFSMADAPVLERAVRRLDQRGVRAIVIVRVFGMEDSFQPEIERLIGRDIESHGGHDQHATHQGHGHGHGDHGGMDVPQPRIRSSAVLLTAGGLEDHPLFAQALVDRAKTLSRAPGRETVILTAHGTNDDARNAKWIELLESIAAKMRANGGSVFRDIRVATWREDWPDKREPWVARVRGWVEEAGRDGDVIVIPARTNGTGPEAKLLAGARFKLGSGFAPHPLFEKWVQEQVAEALQHRHH